MTTRFISLVCVGLFGCTLSHTRVEARLDRAIHRTVSRDDALQHAILHVDAPHLGIDRVTVAGTARPGVAMTADTPFLSASIGKLFVAATVLDLCEEGRLRPSDPVSKWVSAEVLATLPAAGGPAGFDTITVGMLLGHRSGLPDYFDTATHPAADGAPGIAELMVTHPERAWDRASVLAYTAEHFEPYGAPGSTFLYSDLNYDLLGLVLEGVTGSPWHLAVRSRVLEPLGLADTYYHQFEPHPLHIPPQALARAGTVVLTDTPALGLDGAGGGLVTTTGDLVAFMRGLERGSPVSLDVFAEQWTPDALNRGIDYGYGLWRIRPGALFFAMAGLPQLHGVSGSTGSFVYRLEDGTILSGTFDQLDYAEAHIQFLLTRVVPTLARAEPVEL